MTERAHDARPRVALIVGGASGIGAATATALAASGLVIAIADLSAQGADAAAGLIPGEGHRGFEVDVVEEAQLIALFDRVEAELGPAAVLVVAAGTPGYVEGQRPSLRTTPAESWDKVMTVNARGPFLCVREMLRRCEARPVEDGRIILIGSMAAQILSRNSPPSYVASKGAVHALTRVAAAEGAALGLTVNAVAPGAVDTPMLRSVMPRERDTEYFQQSIPGRPGSPEEIAAAVAFLASPSASYVNGACLDVNGGMAMR